MRRVGGLWPVITSFDNLLSASRKAAKGKREQFRIARFLDRLEPEVLKLQSELRRGSYRPAVPSQFTIYDPKERTISVAPFRDRVVHHALIDVLEPYFDRRMVFESFACRRGKGTHAALDHAQRFVRRYDWFLKLDVRKCFESLSHEVVMETLERIVKDRQVLDLIDRIVRHNGASARPGVGLPIGNLTSQWFANLVLDRLDHHIKERLRFRGYVRYMDDFALFAQDRDGLRVALSDVNLFLRNTLQLDLKERATVLAPSSEGLPFLGWRLYRGVRRLRPENKRRTWKRLRHRMWEYHAGRIDERSLADCVRSVTAHLDHGSTRALRQRWFQSGRSPP